MGELTVNGFSDDILNLEGDINWQGYPPHEYNLLLSDGTVLHIEYDWGWNIEITSTGKGTTYELYSKGSEKAEAITGRDGTDVVKLFNEEEFEKAFIIDEITEIIE